MGNIPVQRERQKSLGSKENKMHKHSIFAMLNPNAALSFIIFESPPPSFRASRTYSARTPNPQKYASITLCPPDSSLSDGGPSLAAPFLALVMLHAPYNSKCKNITAVNIMKCER